MLPSIIIFAICWIFVFGKLTPGNFPSGRIDDSHMHSHIDYIRSKHSNINKNEENPNFWVQNAKATIRKKLARKLHTGKAKNVILFLGDGMSIPTLAATRIYLGNKNNKNGEEVELSFEKFPYVGLSKTYCIDRQVADSACTATAYLSGIKANFFTLGVSAAVKQKDCNQMRNISNHAPSIARKFQINGKRTGLVTTSRVTHASPAGVYAYTADRQWESDTNILEDNVDPLVCHDIAHQLVHGETGKHLNVVFGGGRWAFYPNTTIDEEGKRGYRSDGRHLVNEWKYTKQCSTTEYITNRSELLGLPDNTDYVLGLFDSDHLPFNLDRNVIAKPSLEEMTEKAIRLLSHDDKGYFLFVEGAKIDMAHHQSLVQNSLEETVEFHKAIETAARITNPEETLIIVTSDHSHTLSISGYPTRGNDILGLAGMSDIDYLPYATASYANGPGYRKEQNGRRHDLSKDNLKDKNYKHPGMVPLDLETHAGDDVGIFAQGPWAHLLTGVLEQHVIPHVIAFAACLSDDMHAACDIQKPSTCT